MARTRSSKTATAADSKKPSRRPREAGRELARLLKSRPVEKKVKRPYLLWLLTIASPTATAAQRRLADAIVLQAQDHTVRTRKYV